MKNGKLVVGQIGCGHFAEFQDLPNLTKHPLIDVKWCCDIDIKRAEYLAAKHQVENTTADFLEVIADPEIDMIKITTSHEVHLPIIEAAAARGIQIFCEKPMAMNESEALKIITIIRKYDVKLCVDYNRRMAPAIMALRDKYRQQRENPQHQPWRFIEVERSPFPEEGNAQFAITVQDESSSYILAHLNPLSGGGALLGESVHWLDLACWFFAPQLPVEITTCGSTRFSHTINLKFSSGDTMILNFLCSGTFDYPKEFYQVAADSALLQSKFFVENEYFGIPGLEQELFPMQYDEIKNEIPIEGFAGYLKKYNHRARKIGENLRAASVQAPFFVDKGHYNMLDSFVKAIINDTPSPCDEMAGFTASYLAELAIQSIQHKQTMPVLIERLTPAL